MRYLLALWLLLVIGPEAMEVAGSLPPEDGDVRIMDGGSSFPPIP